MIAGFPSGPRPGNLTCGPQEKDRFRKTNPRGKKKQMRPLPGAYLPPARKNKGPQKEKGAAKGKSLLSPDGAAPAGSFFPPGRRASPGSAQEILPAGLKKKNRSRKTNRRGKKKTNLDLFFLTGLGRQTNNQIHVPLHIPTERIYIRLEAVLRGGANSGELLADLPQS